MKVCDLPYRRVTLEEMQQKLGHATQAVKDAATVEQVLAARQEMVAAMKDYSTASSLSYMRFSINTVDPFYVAEKDYYDEISPAVENLSYEYACAMLDSPLRPQLEKVLNPVLFQSFEVQRKAISPAILDDMVEENKLVSRYSSLMSGMEFTFRGETMPRSMLMKYAKDDDRATRKEAYTQLGLGLQAHAAELDEIFDQLVHVRDRMAKKMGYQNFVELGYYRMQRLCFDQQKVEAFRQNILTDVVPVVQRLRTENAKHMGIDRFMVYDYDVVVPGGDPKPSVDKAGIFAAAKEMYHAMSPDTAKFIDMMLENEAFDVDSRSNKWGGGYCTEFANFKQPFILANFNGTAGDVDVVTHEAGHAFNAYMIADNEYAIELGCGGMETAETHSMSMEFFAWPYMDKFFGSNAGRYRYMHALDALSFLPYGTMVDAFQHIVYEKPDLTPAERKAAWRELESQFRPFVHFDGIPYLEEGTRWQYQMHIYESPFYYIDYCLAQTAAFGFLLASQKDYADAFSRYIRLLKQGGERVWTDLLAEAGLPSPFEPGALHTLAEGVEGLLRHIQPEF